MKCYRLSIQLCTLWEQVRRSAGYLAPGDETRAFVKFLQHKYYPVMVSVVSRASRSLVAQPGGQHDRLVPRHAITSGVTEVSEICRRRVIMEQVDFHAGGCTDVQLNDAWEIRLGCISPSMRRMLGSDSFRVFRK